MAAFANPLDAMKSLVGTAEAPGTADNPKILQWVASLTAAAPEQSGYWGSYVHDSIPWCGLAAAEAMRLSGRPWPYVKGDDLHSALWARSWLDVGTPINIADAMPGDVVVFDFGGQGHVSIFDHIDGSKVYVTGGNQSDAVNTQGYYTSSIVGVRRVAASVPSTGVPADSRAEAEFQACLMVTLHWEGGNDDDPRDPGGRTSRGILQREWNEYIKGKPNLPTDVWQAPQADIVAIYRTDYWDKHLCAQMPNGVDLAVFDMRVLSGAGIKILQRVVGTDQDGEVGPLTLKAIASWEPKALIAAIKTARMDYLESLAGWPTFGDGWRNRVNDVTEKALAMAAVIAPPQPVPDPTTPPGDLAHAISALLATTATLGDTNRQLQSVVSSLLGAISTIPKTGTAIVPVPQPPAPRQTNPQQLPQIDLLPILGDVLMAATGGPAGQAKAALDVVGRILTGLRQQQQQ